MKLTKRLLAIVLAAAMLVGMVVISTSAVQLDDDVPTLTWDDCIIDGETNPYTIRLAFKIYKINTSTGEYTLLEDTDTTNDTLDVKVEEGDVLRVECWAQTNFHTSSIQLTPTYNNAWLLPTTISDYKVVATDASYPLKVATANDKTAMDDAFPECENFCDEFGTGDGTMENPVFAGEALSQAKGQINHNSWSGLRGVLPKDWQGKGTAEATWINTDAKDQWGNSIATVDKDGIPHLIYNVYQFGSSANSTSSDTWPGYTLILNVYQPVAYFNLTVAEVPENADNTAKLFFPLSSYYNTSNAYTSFTAVDYDKVQASPDLNGNWDPSIPQLSASGLKTYSNKVTYPDGTQTEKNWIVTNATITVDDGAAGGEGESSSSTTEAPSVAPVNKTALQTAIDRASALDENAYTPASWKAADLATVLASANTVKNDANATQDAVDAAVAAIEAAEAKLNLKANNDALKTAIANASALEEDDYTPASWTEANLAAVIASAQAVVDNGDATEADIADAIAALADAEDMLKLKANKDALKTAIDTLPTVAQDKATSASWKAYTDALAVAQRVYDDPNATQDDVNAAAAALTKATGEVVALDPCDYDGLQAAIDDYNALTKSDWTPASWTESNVDDLATAAKNIAPDLLKDEAGANQKSITDAAAALNAAIKALVPVAKKGDLVAAIARASALNEDAYTPASWSDAALATVLASANAVNADPNATQDAVNAAVAAIEAAEAKLNLKVDNDALKTAIDNAKALDEDDYTPDSWAAANLAAVIASAQAVADNGDATEADIADAIAALAAAEEQLVEVAEKTDLEEAIATLPAIAEEDADPTTWAAYKAALEAAQLVYADPNATQDAVNKAETNLLAAISGVKEKETVYCDYSDLEDAIKAFEALDEDLYTPNSYAVVKGYYDVAKAIATAPKLEYTSENQDAIDEAYDNLHNSMIRDLVEVADKGALKAAIDTVVDTANCTKDSIAKYNAALTEAQRVYDDPNATQDDVDTAKDALVAAQTLEKLPKVDYGDLKDAMDDYEALTESDYTADSWADAKKAYDAAKAILAEDLYDDEDYVNQGRVDEAYDNLLTALNSLKDAVKKDALLDEINKAASIEEDLATDATWAEYANALANAQAVYADPDATQDDVDTAKAELATANGDLAMRDLVNYAALEAALDLVPAEAQDAYTVASWNAYATAKAAAEAIPDDLVDNKSGTNAKLVADAAAALEAAYAALKINEANITNVEWDNTDYYVPGTLAYTFTVNGGASKIQVLSPDGGTMTFDRRSTRVSIVSYNAAGEVIDYADEDPAYEEWTISLVLSAGDYEVRAKYDYTWDTENYEFTVEYDEYDTQASAFTASAGDVVDATEITVAAGDVITFKAVTDATALKVQFVFADGGTSTYSKGGYAVDNGDGTLTWTITRVFAKSQDINLLVKAPTGWDTEYSGNVKVTIE